VIDIPEGFPMMIRHRKVYLDDGVRFLSGKLIFYSFILFFIYFYGSRAWKISGRVSYIIEINIFAWLICALCISSKLFVDDVWRIPAKIFFYNKLNSVCLLLVIIVFIIYLFVSVVITVVLLRYIMVLEYYYSGFCETKETHCYVNVFKKLL
jgi:hypothetical protein